MSVSKLLQIGLKTTPTTQTHIVFAGGGTGGHLFPGIAVAEQLAEAWPGVRITFAGSGKQLEQQVVSAAGHQYLALPSRPVPRQAWEAMRFVADNLAGFWAARWMLRQQRVSLVVGLGGYASAPVVRAAIAQGLPTLLLEQNAIPGRVTRWLAPAAMVVCTAFAETQTHLRSGARVRVTGNPVRRQFTQAVSAPREAGQADRPKQLLVLGGSGGARSLNESVPRALFKMADTARDWQIVHQTGSGQLQATQELYHSLGLQAIVVSFIDNLPEVLSEVDLVITRAGGTTLAELAHAGTPAIVVPYPDAADQHQLENAKVLAAAGACRMIEQHDPTCRLDDRLVRILQGLFSDESARQQLACKIRQFARPEAAVEISSLIQDLLQPAALRTVA